MKLIYYFLILMIALVACNGLKKEISLDIEATNVPDIAVEGYFTNEARAHTIKINTVPSYTSTLAPAPAQGAIVSISSGSLSHSLAETSAGIYQTQLDVAGEVGKTYTLTIQYNNKTFTAVSTLMPPLIIDTLYAVENQDKENNYYLVISSKNEISIDQNFLFKNAKNDILNDTIKNWNYISNYFNMDIKFDNTIISSIDANIGDVIDINCYSVEKEFIDFISAAQEGEMGFSPFFTPTPSNIVTNLSDGAAGYFLATAFETKRCIVE